MTNVFNIATTERFINQHMAGGNGPSWAKNVLLYICKFGDFLLGKQKISQALLAAYKSDSQGMKSTFGMAITKTRIVNQSRRRKAITSVNLRELSTHPNMVSGISALAECDGSCQTLTLSSSLTNVCHFCRCFSVKRIT